MDVQANSARFTYTLHLNEPTQLSETLYCQLKESGLFFSKEVSSFEKTKYSETEVASIVRCILFVFVFKKAPCRHRFELCQNENLDFPSILQGLTITDLVNALDSVMGEGFGRVTKTAVEKIYLEYINCWRYYPCGMDVCVPSEFEFDILIRFVLTTTPHHNDATIFILNHKLRR